MAFQEFHCDFANGSNLNSGFPVGGGYPYSTTNGAYTQGGGAGGGTSDLFAAASGTPFSAVAVGDYVSIYNDGAGAPTTFIGRVTAINGGGASIDVDSTKSSGTRPSTVGSGKTAVVGGYCKGPTGASDFPIDFITSAAKDGSGNFPRINLRNNATYDTTAVISNANTQITIEGYATTPGDGGKATIDGGGGAYNIISFTAACVVIRHIKVQNNTGANQGIVYNATTGVVDRCIATNIGGSGFFLSGPVAISCEAYDCNKSGTANSSGFNMAVNSGSAMAYQCYSHDNTGSTTHGFNLSGPGVSAVECISESNGGKGFDISGSSCRVINCDSYNNGGYGLDARLGANTGLAIINTNFCKNGNNAINYSGGTAVSGIAYYNGFGTGGDDNDNGDLGTIGSLIVENSITYTSPTNPWTAPTTGNFTISAAAAHGTGHGFFLQTGSSKTGTETSLNVGAAQDSGGGGGPGTACGGWF